MKTARRAFTLIELLAVIAIIGVLAAIIITTVGVVRTKARAAQCSSNLRQLGLAFSLYVSEHRGAFPAYERDSEGRLWYNAIRPYFDVPTSAGSSQPRPEVMWCPANNPEKKEAALTGYNQNGSYSYNTFVGGNGVNPVNTTGIRVNDIARPSQLLLLADADDSRDKMSQERPITNCFTQFNWNPPGSLHSGGANVLFCDGHVKWHKASDLVGDRDDPRIKRLWGAGGEYAK